MDFYCDKIISGKMAVEKLVETDNLIAFNHGKPYWEVHVVVVPRRHIDSLAALDRDDVALSVEFMYVLSELAERIASEHGGCRVSTNVGSYQDTKHLHWYIHAGKRLRDKSGRLL